MSMYARPTAIVIVLQYYNDNIPSSTEFLAGLYYYVGILETNKKINVTFINSFIGINCRDNSHQ